MDESVNVLKFAECRAKEIMTLKEEVILKGPKLNFQKLPFHMRRRAASHNPKRLPKSIKAKVADEVLAKHKKKLKSHKNLLEEYNSRQKNDLWLSTHIWFAKRFHMKRMWGYQLPFQATGKRFRSSYRATVKNALLQDLSYFCCIELKGNEEKLLSQLSCLTNESVGINFASKAYIEGVKEGHCFLYQPNAFPFHAIGPVSFLWKPYMNQLSTSNLERQLWIWCHPSISGELIKIFIDIFNLQENSENLSKQYTFASDVNYMKCKLHFQKEPIFCSEEVTMCVLKDTLVRHRILGPNALSILTSVLKSMELTENESSILSKSQQIWNNLSHRQSAYSVPIKSVIGLTVQDPRLHVTSKRKEDLPHENVFINDISEDFSRSETAYSDIWCSEIRNKVTASQIPERVLNEERGKYVIPKASDIQKISTNVPILLIHQPGVNGYVSGWDVIAPQGWGMAFWIPFIYHGAQPAGFDDLCSINIESGCPTFPLSFPDTAAGLAFESETREERLKKFHRYPRAKRPNFQMLGISCPFSMSWKLLIDEWENEFLKKYTCCPATKNDSNMHVVLRSKEEIVHLKNFCTLLQKPLHKQNIDAHRNLVQTLMCKNVHLRALLLIRVKCLSRGIPTSYSGIYLPNEGDLEALKENPNCFGPVEAIHEAKKDLPPRKKRKAASKLGSKELDSPETETIILSSERKIIGYISEGGYSKLGGQGYGIGHCTLTGFLFLLELCMSSQMGSTVFVREQHSFQYRPANIEILSNIF